MRKMVISIVTLLMLVIAGCASTSAVTPPLTTPTPKCKDNICVQEAVVVADDQTLSVMFVITDQNGEMDADNPPQWNGDYITGNLYRIESDGTEKVVFGVYQPGDQYNCIVTNLAWFFKGRLVDLCDFSTPQTATSAKIQSGDRVRVALKEFGFEQVVNVRGSEKLNLPNTNVATITEAFLAQGLSGSPNISVTTFPQNQLKIRLFVIIANATSNTKVKVTWTAVDVGDAAPANTRLGEVEDPCLSGNPAVCVFYVSSPSSGIWPVGKYKADIYLDGTFDRTLEFSIK